MLTLADRLHDGAWARLRATGLGERLWHDRSARGALMATVHVVAALGLTLGAPLWLLLLAPLLLGVPHVVGDVRHLLLKPPHPLTRGFVPALAVPLLGMTALRVVSWVGGPSLPVAELALGAVAVGLGILWIPGRLGLRAGLLAALAVVTIPALLWPRQAALLIGHAHNFVAVGIWVWLVGFRGRGAWAMVGVLGVAIVLLMSGAADGVALAAGPAAGLSMTRMVGTLAPDLPQWLGLRLVLVFALMQAVHYSMWVWCIPASPGRHPEPNPLPPSQRWRRWATDIGIIGVVAAVLGALALPALGLVDPTGARSGYLSLVLFHGWLELAVIAHLVVARARAAA